MIYNCFLETESLRPHLDIDLDLDLDYIDLSNYWVSFKTLENGNISIKVEEPTVLVSQMPEYENIIKARRLTNPKPSTSRVSRIKRAGENKVIIKETQKQDMENNRLYIQSKAF